MGSLMSSRRIHRFLGTGDVSPKVPRVFVRIVNSTREISAMAINTKVQHSESRVKRDRVFFCVWSFIDRCFFIFELSSVRHLFGLHQRTPDRINLLLPPRPSHSSSRIFEAAFSWGSGRCSVERPLRRGIAVCNGKGIHIHQMSSVTHLR